ncbi:MAG: metalloregulator ArsR/SmtB family transcription factor [Anaerolineales bacterium]|nr:metalloregulator ArsR/SmtB family transcription factor [Anaerolineales bacterium]MDW8325995.1 metalloregulator ArsR/SmtB family transcription factor [Anaerolineales bacterium]
MNKTLEREVDQLHAEICAGLADPKRILILYELATGPRNVTELAHSLNLSQPLVSRHLKVLRDRGMVMATRQGAAVEYQLADKRLIEALDILRAVLHDTLSRRAELVSAFEA